MCAKWVLLSGGNQLHMALHHLLDDVLCDIINSVDLGLFHGSSCISKILLQILSFDKLNCVFTVIIYYQMGKHHHKHTKESSKARFATSKARKWGFSPEP